MSEADNDALYQELLPIYHDLGFRDGLIQRAVLQGFLFEWGTSGKRKMTAGEAMQIALTRHGVDCGHLVEMSGAEEYEEILAAQEIMNGGR